MPDGYGFMRSSDYHYLTSPDDVYPTNTISRSSSLSKLAKEGVPIKY